MHLNQKHKELFNTIDEILWKDWDPIGVNDADAARDEYQNYTIKILSLLLNGANSVGIAQRLYQFETTSMGLQGNFNRCSEVAGKILRVYQHD